MAGGRLTPTFTAWTALVVDLLDHRNHTYRKSEIIILAGEATPFTMMDK